MSLKVILTGASGFVGEGVMLACLSHPEVSELLLVTRKAVDCKHPKVKECIVTDFMNLGRIREQLIGYDACYYCAGISSVGLSEETYHHITYDITVHFAATVLELNPSMVFNFVSGSHTDSSERGKVMWARVKGKTENALKAMPFRGQYNFRPGIMKPMPGQRNVKVVYRILAGILPLFFPRLSGTVRDIGLAMINATLKGYPENILEVKDIKVLAHAGLIN